MLVEIWSDVVCPWCAMGRQRFLTALEGFAHRDEVEVVFRSFELDPRAPLRREGSAAEHISRKYGMSVDEASQVAGPPRGGGGTRRPGDPLRPDAFGQHLRRAPAVAPRPGSRAAAGAEGGAHARVLRRGAFAVGDPSELAPVAVCGRAGRRRGRRGAGRQIATPTRCAPTKSGRGPTRSPACRSS